MFASVIRDECQSHFNPLQHHSSSAFLHYTAYLAFLPKFSLIGFPLRCDYSTIIPEKDRFRSDPCRAKVPTWLAGLAHRSDTGNVSDVVEVSLVSPCLLQMELL